MKTSRSDGVPTGRQPLVARLRLTLFCLVALRFGGGDGCFCRVRLMESDPLEGLLLCGHSLASFNLAGGWSRPESGVSRWGLVWVAVGTVDKGQLDTGIEGDTRREGL